MKFQNQDLQRQALDMINKLNESVNVVKDTSIMSTHLLKKRKPLTNINEDIKKSDSDTNGPSEKRKNKLRAKQSEIAVITADIAGPTIEASN